jgi:HEAT repeat protein
MPPRRKSVGVFTTDRALVVQSWDPWLADATGIAESTACGRPLAELFPDLLERGLMGRLRKVADDGVVEVLAPAFHKYLLPCRPLDPQSPFERMRQHVTLTPLRTGTAIDGIVATIEDVTPRLQREHELAADLESHDEEVRLRATQSMANTPHDVSALANALSDRSWRVRRAAAQGMARAGGQQAVDTLIEALREHHRDPAVLNSALTALARSREDVVGAVIALLTLEDAAVRTYAALALGLLEDSRGVPPLIGMLNDPDVNVRYHVIEALGRIGDSSAVDDLVRVALSRDFFLSFAALDALALIGEPSVARALVPLLQDDALREPTAQCIGALGDASLAEPLTRLITPTFPDVAVLARALAAIDARLTRLDPTDQELGDVVRQAAPERTAQRLIDRLEKANDADAEAIAVVLAWLDAPEVDAALARLLRREAIRARVGDILSRRGSRAMDALLSAMREGDPGVQHVCAVALGRIGGDKPVPELIRLLQGEPEVAIAAAGALGAIGARGAFQPLLAKLGSPHAMVRQAAVSALNSIGHRDMEWAIATRLTDPDPKVRESAARVAGYFGYPSALAPLLELTRDDDENVRRAAIEHVANYDDERAARTIEQAMKDDPAVSVRSAAVRALGVLDTASASSALLRACDDKNLWVRYFAVRTATRRAENDAKTVAVIRRLAMQDTAPPVRIAAIEALGELKAVQAAADVASLTTDAEPEVARAALLTLGRIGSEEQSAALRDALREGDGVRAGAALESVGRLRLVSLVDDVVALARDHDDLDLRMRAVGALAEIGSPDALSAMMGLSRIGRLRAAVVAAMRHMRQS